MSTIAMMMVGSGFAAAGGAFITSGDCDQCSIMVIAICDSVSASEKDLCAHGIEGDIRLFPLGWQILMKYGDIKADIP